MKNLFQPCCIKKSLAVHSVVHIILLYLNNNTTATDLIKTACYQCNSPVYKLCRNSIIYKVLINISLMHIVLFRFKSDIIHSTAVEPFHYKTSE